MTEWFYRLNGTNQGPVSEADLKHIFDSGALPLSTPVWHNGMEEWVEANEMKQSAPSSFQAHTGDQNIQSPSTFNSQKPQHGHKYLNKWTFSTIVLVAVLGIMSWTNANKPQTTDSAARPEDNPTQPPMTVERAKSIFQNFFNGNMNVRDEQGFNHSVPAAQALFDAIHPIGTGKSVNVNDVVLNKDSSGNLESVGLDLTLLWEGPIQNGSTTFRMRYDPKSDHFDNIKVERTDGITRDDIENFAVGYQIGAQIHDAFSDN